MVRGTWKRGHKGKFDKYGTCAEPEGAGVRPPAPRLLPGPDADDDDLDAWLDVGEIGPPPDLDEDRSPEDDPELLEHYGPEDEIAPDPPPRHVTPGPQRGRPRGGHGSGKIRVTATVRRDIEAKLGLMLMVPGRIWASRDPLCGGAFIESEPEIRAAAVELICQSADLIAFFEGAGGGFMLWLNLMVACQPVLMTVWAHHIAHSLKLREDGAVMANAPDMTQYAA